MNRIVQRTGYGLEAEGFLKDTEGNLAIRVEGQPTAEFVVNAVREKYASEGESLLRAMHDKLALEEASVNLEGCSGVHSSIEGAAREILTIRDAVNETMAPYGVHWDFDPVAQQHFEFIAATSDSSSRTHYLIQAWAERIYHTAIAGLQLNDSTLFAACQSDDERWERARHIMNSHTPDVIAQMSVADGEMRSFKGMTRLEHLRTLIPHVKWEPFSRRGYTETSHVLYPPKFTSRAEMEKWMKAHADKDDLSRITAKDIHSGTVKIKQVGPWIAENRVLGAHPKCHTVDGMMAHLRPVIEHHNQLRSDFGLSY